ncbi:MAG: RsmE family RNA methyltransferase [Bacteroidota bacterium]
MQIFHLQVLGEHKGKLHAEEAHHCVKVLRHAVGDAIHTIDGEGRYFPAIIEAIQKDGVLLQLGDANNGWGESPFQLAIGISPLAKKDRFEWFLEKSVELGIDHITPILCKRTGPGRLPRQDRMEKILLAATKQSKRSQLPHLSTPIPFESYVKQTSGKLKMVAWCESHEPLQGYSTAIKDAISIDLLIGPEGDFTENEVTLAIGNGFHPVSLGENRLRSETAGIYLLGALKTYLAY